MAGVPGGVVIQTIVWRCRDHNSIAVDVDVGRGRPPPFEARCIYPPDPFPPGGERDRSRSCRWRRSSGSSRRWRRQLKGIDFVIGVKIYATTSVDARIPLAGAGHRLGGPAAVLE